MERTSPIRQRTATVTSPRGDAGLEAGTYVQLETSGSQDAPRSSKSATAIHVRVHAVEIHTIEQVNALTSRFDLHLLAEEPGSGEELGKVEVHVVVSQLIVSVSAEVSFRW